VSETLLHPIQRRWNAEDLVRRRRSDEARRYAAPQRSGRIDANPHQIEAVIFALSRLGDGGCILADEVGLGKTIEAGLVIAQLRAEGARRILLITPKPLLGQWRQELFSLFGIDATDAWDETTLAGDGVFLIGREAAGSEKGRAVLLGASPFDLVVIDEAHEVFGGLYKRFDAAGQLREDAPAARTAGRLFDLVRAGQGPVLLLTATPIQNSLSELWALVRYVDPMGTLLGDLRTFRLTFCDKDDRVLAEGQGEELRRRVGTVLRRTLRRQAQAFLTRPFVARQARLFEYPMAENEKKLYEDVTAYVMSTNGAAFRGNHRRLLLIGFHRRMASSAAALAATLEKVAARLKRMLQSDPGSDQELVDDIVRDLEDEELLDVSEGDLAAEVAPLSPEAIRAELSKVEDFVARAKGLTEQGKSRALVDAARLILARGRDGQGSGKMVIFTESVVTQEYIRALLIGSGLVTDDQVTLFRGTNNSPRAREALARWEAEEGAKLPDHSKPSRDIAMRLGLVHEFATRSKVFVSTEAGAKGLNLQFCETVINFDLPWNPQRIEQRIGRCHRYGQTRDVTVINFLAQGNETERLTFEILGKKLELFGTVLDASDAVLHRAGEISAESLVSAVGTDLEASLNRIWQRARTVQDVEEELRELRDRFSEIRRQFEEEQERTSGLIESYFDGEVRRVFTRRSEELPAALADLDSHLERVVIPYLDALGATYETHGEGDARILEVKANPALPAPLASGLTVAVGRSTEHESLHLAHPLVAAAVEAARKDVSAGAVGIRVPAEGALSAQRGRRGRLVGVLAHYRGMETVERLIAIAVLEGDDEPIQPDVAQLLLGLPMRQLQDEGRTGVTDDQIGDAIEEAMFRERRTLSSAEEPQFELGLEQLERFVEDRARLLRRNKVEADGRLEEMRARRDTTVSVDAREKAEEAVVRIGAEVEALDEALVSLERRDDETYQRCRDRLHQRRYAPASVETLFDVGLLLE
jgi:hypothetical protein